MSHKISVLYSWVIRTITFHLPDIPFFMRMRGSMYSLLMKECGSNFQITSSAYLNSLSGLDVGKNVYIAHNVVVIGIDIKIGDNTIIGPNCVISGGNHRFKDDSFRFEKSTIEAVEIGSGSWVAANCTITGGSKLPDMSILAAGSVLTKKQSEAKSVYKGAPAKFSHYHIKNKN